MRLRCLAGRYAGQIQNYSPFAGMSALRTGMAERVTDARPTSVPVTPVAAVAAAGVTAPAMPTSTVAGKRKK